MDPRWPGEVRGTKLGNLLLLTGTRGSFAAVAVAFRYAPEVPKGIPGLTNTPPGHLVGQSIGAWTLRSYDFIGPSRFQPDPMAGVGGDGSEAAVRLDLAHHAVPVSGPLRLAKLVVRFRSSESHACSVTLAPYGSDVRRSLSRFPLATWLAVADTVRRSYDTAARDGSPTKGPDRSRPGRAGHGDAFYRDVARRYRDLQGADSAKPTQTIAEEAGVSRNTAAGWVRRAREQGFLPRIYRY